MVIEGGGYLRVTKMIFGEIIKLMTSLDVSFGKIKNHDRNNCIITPLLMAFGNTINPSSFTCIGLANFGPIF